MTVALSLFGAVSVVCIVELNASVINCGFEKDWCGYENDPNDDGGSFQLNTGPTSSSNTGPSASKEGQYYTYLPCDSTTQYDKARLESPVESPVLKKCLKFAYHMYGSNIWALMVYMKTSAGLGVPIWKQSTDQGNTWHDQVIEITSLEPFQIVFEAHAGSTTCDIAIDDVKLTDCPAQAGISHEPWSQWRKCSQSCGANYYYRLRFSYSSEPPKTFNFTYHFRYSTSEKLCPEKHRWYFDNLKDGVFRDEYGKADAMVVSGSMDSNDRMLTIDNTQDSVKIHRPEVSCVLGRQPCKDGFTLSLWIFLQVQQGVSSILSSSNDAAFGLKILLSTIDTLTVLMETDKAKWNITTNVPQGIWIHMTITWSECYGLSYYENGDLREHSGIAEKTISSGSLSLTDNDDLFIGKSGLVQGALLSITELVIWDGQLSPADIRVLSRRVDQTERFGFLKPVDGNTFEWSKGYASTPSNETGPRYTHLRSEFDVNQEGYKPSSCSDIKHLGGATDGYHVIFPRGSCGDSLKVFCADMNTLLPKEYVDVNPAVNFGTKNPAPCSSLVQGSGRTTFHKVRLVPDTMKITVNDHRFSTIEGEGVNYGGTASCYYHHYTTCSHASEFMINLMNTGLRVKSSVKWKGTGHAPHYEIIMNFERSRDGQEVSANCGGFCGVCQVDGPLEVELVSCSKKKPRSCFDVKKYLNVTEDGYFVIYPVSTGLLPLRVFCFGMATSSPAEYLDVLTDGKNYALGSPDRGLSYSCTLSSSPVHPTYENKYGLTNFSKVRVDIQDKLRIVKTDYRFTQLVFGFSRPLGYAGSCFSYTIPPCLPRGYFNIDLSGSGIGVKPSVKWGIGGWPASANTLFSIKRGIFGQVIDGNCGSYCGSCQPDGELFVDLIVPHDRNNWKYFGENNKSLIETTDAGRNGRSFELATVCSVAVGCEDGTIPDDAFSSSSKSIHTNPQDARLKPGTKGGWRPKNGDQNPWLRVDLMSVRLVTGIATMGNCHTSSPLYVTSYLVSYSFDAVQWITYSNIANIPFTFPGNENSCQVKKHSLKNPMFARYVRFHLLTWFDGHTRFRVEVYICPRGMYHHLISTPDYFYLESSYPRVKGDRSELVTRTLLPAFRCMHFWYHVTGADMGRLDVYVEEIRKERKMIWSIAGDRGQYGWQQATIPLAVNNTFRVYVSGIIGDGYRSDLAVGGVSFTTGGNCTFVPPHASPTEGEKYLEKCASPASHDPITGKCVCKNKDFVGETCENKLLETIYRDAVHYWSFDDVDIKDLITGRPASVDGSISRVPGPVNQAMQHIPDIKSRVDFGSIRYLCLSDPSLCSSGLTITVWIKYEAVRNVRFFLTRIGRGSGVMLVGSSEKEVEFSIYGSSHFCKVAGTALERIWSFVGITWSLLGDGTGELILYHNDVFKANKICAKLSRDYEPKSKEMATGTLITSKSFSIDELAIWNQTLSATRVLEIFSNVTRSFSNTIVSTFRLQPLRWHPAFLSDHSEEWKEAKEHIVEPLRIDGSITEVGSVWVTRETDECIYTGFVQNGVPFLRENSTFRCNEEHFEKNNFHLELSVNMTGATVRLNDINLGAVRGNFPSAARWGLLDSVAPGDIPVLIRNYQLNSADNLSLLDYQDCDMTKSGKFGSEYTLFGDQVLKSTKHCMALRRKKLVSGSYKAEVQLYHISGDHGGTYQMGNMGIVFNYKDNDNYDIFIIRTFILSSCFSWRRKEDGIENLLVNGACPVVNPVPMQKWLNLTLLVRTTHVEVYLDGDLLTSQLKDSDVNEVMVGVAVYNGYNIYIRFKDFIVVHDQYQSMTNSASSRTFDLPPSKSMKRHTILSTVEPTGLASGVYSVSSDFRFAEYSYTEQGPFTSGFGLSFNVKDELNFDFVYYWRRRTMFSNVTRMLQTTTWQENEHLVDKIKNSSFILIERFSTKVPTHIPFNVTAMSPNSTSINVSWHWTPDYDVTGLFQGFRVLYRIENDTGDLWEELIVYDWEFEQFSSVVIHNLRKATAYILKVVAFTLTGDGWPTKEIFNSTCEDIPDIIDLNVTLRNIDLQTVLVLWDSLPTFYRNGKLTGYIVSFQEISTDETRPVVNQTRVLGETTNTTLGNLKHFTNYTVTVMAFNHMGISLPTKFVDIETLEHVPAIPPPDVLVTVLNTSAITVSWKPIEKDLWNGLRLGYVVYFNESSNALRNNTITPSNSELTITNLTAFTFYDVSVAGYTREGPGPKSPTIRIATPEEVPAFPPNNPRVTFLPDDSNLSCIFSWDPLPKTSVRGIIRGYKATYEPLRVLYLSQCTPPCPPLTNRTVNTTSNNITVNDCLWYTNYSFQVLAFTVADGVKSSVLYATSPEGVPFLAPPNVSVVTLNTSALLVSWEPIEEFFWRGSFLGFVINYNYTSSDVFNVTVPPGQLQLHITNLTAFTFLHITVAGYTRKGLGRKSHVVRVRTAEEVPQIAPVNVRVIMNQSLGQMNSSSSTNVVQTSFSTVLEWDPVPESRVRGVIRGYKVVYEPLEVYYVTRARRSLSNLSPITVNSSTATIHLQNLLFYTNYSVQVMAYTVGDGVAVSSSFMTPEGAPSEGPPNVRASHEGSKSSLLVKWDAIPVSLRNGILKGYHIYYKESSSSGPSLNLSVSASTTGVTITELQTFTSYNISVCGFTIVGDGVCSTVTALTRSYDLAPYTAVWNASTKLSSPLSILFIWVPFPESYWHENPRGYMITFQKVAFGGKRVSGEPVTIVRVGYKTSEYSWPNLSYYTKYRIEIFTITYRGFGPKTVVFGETCNCPMHMTSTFRLLPPYVMEKSGNLRGIIPDLIRQMTSTCCVSCATYSGTQVDFKKDGHGNPSQKSSHAAFISSFDESTTFAFPIYGYMGQTSYSTYGFIPGVQSPGMVIIVHKKSPGSLASAVLDSIFRLWPLLLVNVLLAFAAGAIMWVLDSSSNEIFPRTCIRGILEGFWWAYISMTTVGYGDTTAKTFPARIFAIVWILLGLCTTSMLVGDLSSSLSVAVSVPDTMLYGSKVAALNDSREESVAIRGNAKIVGGPYYTLEQIQQSVLSGKVDVAIVDLYMAALTQHLWNHTNLRITKILDYGSTYGIAFSGDTAGVQYCFRTYMNENGAEIMKIVEKYAETLKSVKTESATEYLQNLVDVQSTVFRRCLVILCASLGAVFFVGIVWNFTCKRRRSTSAKKDNAVHAEKTEDVLDRNLKNFCSRTSQALREMKKRHVRQIRKLNKLKQR